MLYLAIFQLSNISSISLCSNKCESIYCYQVAGSVSYMDMS